MLGGFTLQPAALKTSCQQMSAYMRHRDTVLKQRSGSSSSWCAVDICMCHRIITTFSVAHTACRQMLLMPVESEVAAFTGSADKGARQASAALVIQEAYRMYRHRQLVKVRGIYSYYCTSCCLPLLISGVAAQPALHCTSCANVLCRQRCGGCAPAGCGVTSSRSGRPGPESS